MYFDGDANFTTTENEFYENEMETGFVYEEIILDNPSEQKFISPSSTNFNGNDLSKSKSNFNLFSPKISFNRKYDNKSSSYFLCQSKNDISKSSNKLLVSRLRQRKPKEKVFLSPEGLDFKKEFYKIFGIRRKKFSKFFVIEIHNIIKEPLGLGNIIRNEYRSIDNYFKNYAFAKKMILDFITQNKHLFAGIIERIKQKEMEKSH